MSVQLLKHHQSLRVLSYLTIQFNSACGVLSMNMVSHSYNIHGNIIYEYLFDDDKTELNHWTYFKGRTLVKLLVVNNGFYFIYV